MGGGGAAASPAADEGGRREWRRIFQRLVSMLRASEAQGEALAADRAYLEAFAKSQHEFWSAHAELLQTRIDQMRREETKGRKMEGAKLDLLLVGKEQELLCYHKLAELAENDLQDFRTCVDVLTAEISKLKIKLKEAESHAELIENTKDDRHSSRDLRAELRKLKQAYKTLSSSKDKEVSALFAEKDFVWNQLKTMESDYTALLKTKKIEAAQATEAAHKLQQYVEELEASAQDKDDKIKRLQEEAESAKEKILTLDNELLGMHSLAKERDEEIEKLKGDMQKLRKDIAESSSKATFSEDPALQKKLRNPQVTPLRSTLKGSRTRRLSAKQAESRSRNDSRKQKVENEPETSQKRKRASRETSVTNSSSLVNGLHGCSTRLQKKAMSPVVHPVLFTPSFKVPKLKTPTPPQSQAPL